jgi:hypothetical protein
MCNFGHVFACKIIFAGGKLIFYLRFFYHAQFGRIAPMCVWIPLYLSFTIRKYITSLVEVS